MNRTARIGFAVLLVLVSACAATRPKRTIAVELQLQPPFKCLSCVDQVASVLKEQEGVTAVRAVKERNSALVYFQDGGANIDDLKRVVAVAGYATRVIWGPAAVAVDGGFERIPIDRVVRARPSLKNQPKAPLAPGPAAIKSGYAPPDRESVPAPTE